MRAANNRCRLESCFNGFVLWVAFLTLLCSGCLFRKSSAAKTPSFRPSNVYRAGQKLPAEIRRVAVLPVSIEYGDWQAEESLKQLEPVLHTELGKRKRFELIMVAPEQLRQWTGKGCWSAEEKLPIDLFERLQEALGCDATLFSQLRPYHAYKPLVVGWNFKLVGAKNKSILWSADEVFDASEQTVANAAEDYYKGQAAGPAKDPSSVLMSPRRFSQFTLSAVLGTLPER